MGDLDTHLTHGSFGLPESSTQMHLDWFSHFYRAHYCGRRQTDHATRSVTIGRIYVRSTAMQANNNLIYNAQSRIGGAEPQ